MNKPPFIGPLPLCACGCGQVVNINKQTKLPNKYLYGHYNRSMSPMTKLCACGCGKEVTINQNTHLPNKYISGHNSVGKKRSKKIRQKISEAQMGERNHNYGKHLSKETKDKISKIKKNRIVSEETKQKQSKALSGEKNGMFGRTGDKNPNFGRTGENNPNYGRKASEETKQKQSESMKGKMSGEKHWNWQNGALFEPYCYRFNESFKEKIRNRDNRTCQNCGVKENGRRHTVHHIHYDKENCYPDLITLCNSCNGKANYNRDYWEAYYMNKLNDRGLLNWTSSNAE